MFVGLYAVRMFFFYGGAACFPITQNPQCYSQENGTLSGPSEFSTFRKMVVITYNVATFLCHWLTYGRSIFWRGHPSGQTLWYVFRQPAEYIYIWLYVYKVLCWMRRYYSGWLHKTRHWLCQRILRFESFWPSPIWHTVHIRHVENSLKGGISYTLYDIQFKIFTGSSICVLLYRDDTFRMHYVFFGNVC